MSEHVAEVTDAAFEAEVLQSAVPVLVDFWAPWCGPCRMLGPRVEKVAAALAGKVKVVKLNVDENTETAGNYGIRSIPTLLWFKGGELVDQVVGLQDEDTLKAKCEALL
ncbi:MAG: thioredoxin [Fimbriimonadaceae bacterium]|nr:thioredoxin [Fimbriimonadaceae bacterium]